MQGQAPQQPPPFGAGVLQASAAQQQPGTHPTSGQQNAAPSRQSWAASPEGLASIVGPVMQPQQHPQQNPADMGQQQHASPVHAQPAGTASSPQTAQPCLSAALPLPVALDQRGGAVQSSSSGFQPSPPRLREPQHPQQQAQQASWAHRPPPVSVDTGAAGQPAIPSASNQHMQAAPLVLPAPDSMAAVLPASDLQHRTSVDGECGSAEQVPYNAKAEAVVSLPLGQATANPPSSPTPASPDVIDLSQTPDSDQSEGLTGAESLVGVPCTHQPLRSVRSVLSVCYIWCSARDSADRWHRMLNDGSCIAPQTRREPSWRAPASWTASSAACCGRTSRAAPAGTRRPRTTRSWTSPWTCGAHFAG